jgi:hypothetical protein
MQTPRNLSRRWVQGGLDILAESIVTVFSTRLTEYTFGSKYGRVFGPGCKAQPTEPVI